MIRRWSDTEVGRLRPSEKLVRKERLPAWEEKWEEESGPTPWQYTDYFGIHCLGFSPNGSELVAGAEQGYVMITDRSANRMASWKGHEGTVRAVTFHPKQRMLASGAEDLTIRLWQVNTNGGTNMAEELVAWTAHADAVTALEFHPEGRYLVSGSESGEVKLWDLEQIRSGLKRLRLAWMQPPPRAP